MHAGNKLLLLTQKQRGLPYYNNLTFQQSMQGGGRWGGRGPYASASQRLINNKFLDGMEEKKVTLKRVAKGVQDGKATISYLLDPPF